jgi:DNA-binding CsgD family transcriptional regulator
MLFEDDRESAFRSEMYNDFFRPNKILDHLGMAFVPDGAADVTSIAMVNCQSPRATDPRFAERGLTIMRLLRPAFCAAVLTRRASIMFRREMGVLLDVLPTPARLVTTSGKIAYQNEAFTRLTTSPETSAAIEVAIARITRCVAQSIKDEKKTAASRLELRPCENVRHGKTNIRVVGVRIDVPGGLGTVASNGPFVLITLDGVKAPPNRTALRETYQFTRRECEVAEALARGATNKSIASKLGISEHTVRHHIENIFLKMNVTSKAEAAAVLSS